MAAQDILIEKYGQPGPDCIHNFGMIWEVQQDFPWFPVKRFLVLKDFKDLLFNAFTQLVANNLHTEIVTFDGCYNDRAVRGANRKSVHSWMAAIDLNAALNPMAVNPVPQQRQGKWSLAFIKVMKDAGIFFGGDFLHRADAMHFSLVQG